MRELLPTSLSSPPVSSALVVTDALHHAAATGRWPEFLTRLHDIRDQHSSHWKREEWLDWLNDYACGLRAAGQWQQAREWQRLAQQLMHHEDPGVLSNSACDAYLAGDFVRAEQLWFHTLMLELGTGNWRGAAADWGNLGLLAAQRGQVRWARRCLVEALRLHRRCGDQLQVGHDLLHLSLLALGVGKWTTARKLAARSAEVFQSLGNHALVQRAHETWAEAYHAQSRLALEPELN